MACCGQRRAAAVVLHPNASTAAMSATEPAVTLRYAAQRPVQVRGALTGRLYSFSADERLRPVDRRDVVGLLRTGLFRTS